MPPLQVCIDARLYSGKSGGVEQVVIGLANGLTCLSSVNEVFSFLVYRDSVDWLTPYLPTSAKLLTTKVTPSDQASTNRLPSALRPHAISLIKAGRNLGVVPHRRIVIPQSDTVIEAAGIEVIHFPIQNAFLTDVPSIYHPHDLQHIHLPTYFSQYAYDQRELFYRAFCSQAEMVAVATTWVQHDVMRQYDLTSEKVRRVPLAPPLGAYDELDKVEISQVAVDLQLPPHFIFYPAQTWPHKNHIKLLEALAILRDKHGQIVHFVSSGKLNDYYRQIRLRVKALKLEDQVRFLGFVSSRELQCLYKLSTAVVIPTLFEAGSFLLWEAFLAGRPTLCSNVTSLPAQAGGAALIFDPHDTDEIADSIRRLLGDKQLRNILVERGRDRVSHLSWELTARLFRAHYRRLGKRSLSDEDHALLASNPMSDNGY